MTREELKERISDIIYDVQCLEIKDTGATELILKAVDEYTKPKGKSLEERKQGFRNEVRNTVGYEIYMLDDFIDYWTEHGPKDKKMRFEKEKSFNISRRLKTWARNAQRFGNKNTGINLEEW